MSISQARNSYCTWYTLVYKNRKAAEMFDTQRRCLVWMQSAISPVIFPTVPETIWRHMLHGWEQQLITAQQKHIECKTWESVFWGIFIKLCVKSNNLTLSRPQQSFIHVIYTVGLVTTGLRLAGVCVLKLLNVHIVWFKFSSMSLHFPCNLLILIIPLPLLTDYCQFTFLLPVYISVYVSFYHFCTTIYILLYIFYFSVLVLQYYTLWVAQWCSG